MKDSVKGSIYVLIAAIFFSLGGLFIKLLPWNALSINAGRCVFSSLVIIVFMRITKQKFVFNRYSILGAISVFGSLSLYSIANKYTTAANAIVLEYTAPIYIIIFDYLLFKKKAKKSDVISMIFVLIGIVIVFGSGLKAKNTFGDFIALLSGIAYALVLMLNEFKGGDAMSSLIMGQLLCIPFGFSHLINETVFTKEVIIIIVTMGIVQAGLGYSFLVIGTKYADPLAASLIASIEPILNPVIVALFYNEKLTLYSTVGTMIVILSIAINSIYKTRFRIRK